MSVTYELYEKNTTDARLYKMKKNGVEFGHGIQYGLPDAPFELGFSDIYLQIKTKQSSPVSLRSSEHDSIHVINAMNRNVYAHLNFLVNRYYLGCDGEVYEIVDGGTIDHPVYALYKGYKLLAVMEKSTVKSDSCEEWQERYEMTAIKVLPDYLALLMLTLPLYRREPFSPTEKANNPDFANKLKRIMSKPQIGGVGILFILLLIIGLCFGAYKTIPGILYNHRMSSIEINETYPSTGEAIAAYDRNKEKFDPDYVIKEHRNAKPEEVRYILLCLRGKTEGGSYYGSYKNYVNAEIETAYLTLIDRTTSEVIAEERIEASFPKKVSSGTKHLKLKLDDSSISWWASVQVKKYANSLLENLP